MDDPSFETSGQAVALAVFSCLAMLIMIGPLVVHWRGVNGRANIGQVSQIAYLLLANLFTMVNAIIWPNSNFSTWWMGYGLCDVEAKLKWPIVTGVASTTLCVTRRLAIAVDLDQATMADDSRKQVQRKKIVDLIICFLVPFLQLVLHYVVQYNRYYLFAIEGCAASYDNSWPTILVMYIWPVIFSLCNCYYSVVIIIRLRRHRNEVATMFSQSSKQTLSTFVRLFINSLALVIVYTPISIYFFVENVSVEWVPYDWSIIHSDQWWDIVIVPEDGARSFQLWCAIVFAFFVFLSFGIGVHACEVYRGWLLAIGTARIFPSLAGPRLTGNKGSAATAGSTTWRSKLSLVSRTKAYFENAARSTTLQSVADSHDLETLSSTRKSSFGAPVSPTHDAPPAYSTGHGTINKAVKTEVQPAKDGSHPSIKTKLSSAFKWASSHLLITNPSVHYAVNRPQRIFPGQPLISPTGLEEVSLEHGPPSTVRPTHHAPNDTGFTFLHTSPAHSLADLEAQSSIATTVWGGRDRLGSADSAPSDVADDTGVRVKTKVRVDVAPR